jgi:Tfp pilus assembly protein PilX
MRARRPVSSRAGRREEGFVLFLAIFVLLIVTVAGLATMLTTTMDLTLSGNETKVSKVFYAADSGVGYSAARLRSDVNFVGGTMPVGVSSNYGGSTAGDIQVTITRPLQIGQQVHFGDGLLAEGTTYGTPQIVETLFRISSTATSTSIQASKTIQADIAIYPQILSNVPQ